MPHIQIDYSANAETRIDLPALCRALRNAAVATGVFPLAGVRVRAVKVDHWVIADGDPQHAFIDISVRLRGGRSLQIRQNAAVAIFAAAEALCAPALAETSFMLSLEMRDIDPDLSPKSSSIRRYLPE
ncbi:MAG: 5-carboxymethyl-2-hydroxymuconate isomerase [Cypionkella sp.]